MATKKKMLQAAAGQAGGEALNVEDVFSTYLYDGTGAAQTITNGIDLDGEGGLVWSKLRSGTESHVLLDSERSNFTAMINSDTTNAQGVAGNFITSTNSTGYTIGSNGLFNSNGSTYVSWTFRKAPKFFDVVTYTGTGSAQTIAHNLGSVPGCIIVKQTNGARDWPVYHRGIDATNPSHYKIPLNKTEARANEANIWNDTEPTSTHFTVGSDGETGGSGNTYVAYLFAHNDGDGEFGPDGDADIIKCGSYTSSNPTNRPEVDLGFEPQWLLIKNATASSNWMLVDNMRGIVVDGDDQTLAADSNAAENGIIGSPNAVALTPTGFKLTGGVTASNAGTGNTHIYMAIRRGTKVPESATEVFEVFETTNTGTASTIGSMGPSDFILNKRTDAAATWRAIDRLRGGSMLRTDSTDTETSASNFLEWDKMGGVFVTTQGAPYITNDSQAHWMWKRAPGFFDAVAYSGNSTGGRTVSHNLGVAPEMIWVKKRNAPRSWKIYHSATGNGSAFEFDSATAGTSIAFWNNTTPTDSVFSLGSSETVNGTGDTYISYLFASLDGISKVGSYTGTGATLNINCGFTSGARFVLIKKTSSTGHWIVFDTARGIVSGNDPFLQINRTSAEVTAYDVVDPYSSGFTLTSDPTYGLNTSGASYIFYAIA